MLGLLRAWWNTPDSYDWTMSYLALRSSQGAARVLIGSFAALMGAMGLFVLVIPYAPTSTVGIGSIWALAAGAFGFAALWWSVLPSRTGSIAFVAYADVAATFVCTQMSDPVYAMFALSSLIVGGAYATFFHGSKVLVAHVSLAAVAIVAVAVRVVQTPGAGVFAAVAMVALAGATNVGMPLFVQFGFWALRGDAADSFVDPLTGLLNRRGVQNRVADLVGRDEDDDLVVLAIDLDRFKEINDRHGHTVGDQVLQRTAQRITSVIRASALLARMGGEEFLVVDRLQRAGARGLAERIRLAVAEPSDRVPTTASIGVACLAIDEISALAVDPTQLLERLVLLADTAMYRAKAAGRNTVIVGFGSDSDDPDAAPARSRG